jgi:hypothetical protein
VFNSTPQKKVCKFPDLARSRYRGVDRPKCGQIYVRRRSFSLSGAREGFDKGSYPALERKNGYESRVEEKHKLENKELVSAILG